MRSARAGEATKRFSGIEKTFPPRVVKVWRVRSLLSSPPSSLFRDYSLLWERKTINNKIQIHFSIIHLNDLSFIDFLLQIHIAAARLSNASLPLRLMEITFQPQNRRSALSVVVWLTEKPIEAKGSEIRLTISKLEGIKAVTTTQFTLLVSPECWHVA